MGTTKISDYEIIEELGTGSYGIVKKAIHKETSLVVAIKFFQTDVFYYLYKTLTPF
jgi:serine/threonine protein kinase